jgi:hypothetical protein
MAAKPPPHEVAQYDAFQRSVKIVSVRFATANVQAPDIYIPNPARRLKSEVKRQSRYLNFTNGFIATMRFYFRGWWEDQAEVGVTAEAEVEVLYSSPTPMTDELFKVFQSRGLAPHAWPYLREFLHTSLARTGWPVQTLPVYVVGTVRRLAEPDPGSGGLVE